MGNKEPSASIQSGAIQSGAIQSGTAFNSAHEINIEALMVHAVHQHTPYNRDDYHTHWQDKDGDCMNIRHEVLRTESLRVPNLTQDGCRVVGGLWYDNYSGAHYTNPRELDIDHVVPLKEAHISGGSAWSVAKRHAFAQDIQDPETLIAVHRDQNRRKGAQDPAHWMPPNIAYHCQYIHTWVAIKQKWALSIDAQERDFLVQQRKECE